MIFPWLAAVVLGLPPERLGLVQMALMAPSIVFTLLGGVIADRADTRRLLSRYHVVAVARVVVRSETATVAAPWGGPISYRLGGVVFLIVTAVALVLVARAAWSEEA